ncbi:DUF1580 domain-containing protein [Bythopirellula polymerisocia]|uniref:Uncharacterized protein n=1 Tax=Bythopirellula polymerisocia TaxID=2528003 RepID=A0A5C6CUS0_9BACT|nr:DUF1580 domain-containing protein [Bythopirellula polymerisocia]TWU27394.1 hypothetical protein Pla144_21670 [Bythopirellula polymerisocia]
MEEHCLNSDIDIFVEDRITLNQLAKELEKSPSTTWRWYLSGANGVKLETFVEGGRRYTTRQAHRRFQQRCTDAANGNTNKPSVHTASRRMREYQKAELELKKQGF